MVLLGGSTQHRHISISVERRFVAVFNRSMRRDACLDIKRPVVQPVVDVRALMHMEAGSWRRRKVSRHFAGWRKVISRAADADVSNVGRVPSPSPSPAASSTSPRAGSRHEMKFNLWLRWICILSPALRKLGWLSTHKHGITIRGPYPRSDPFFRPGRTGQAVPSSWLPSLCE